MSKAQVFEKQYNLIENVELRELVKQYLEVAPDYFYTMPASTTGKYHPSYCLGEGGLVRHTKAAVKIANDLLSLEMYEPLSKDRDSIIAALLLHDTIKKGKAGSNWSTFDHPLQAANTLVEVAENNKFNDKVLVENVCKLIRSHMGQWNYDYRTKCSLPKPVTKLEAFVHQCDYLASRKYLIVEDLDNV